MPSEPKSEQAKIPLPEEKPEHKDWFLALLVSHVNDLPINFDVTLTVGGTQITGYLISRQDYFDKLARLVNEATRSGIGKDIPDVLGLQQLADGIRSNTAQDKEAGVHIPISYIHLDHAQIFAPGCQPIPQQGMLWRGRLEAVDGFIIGRLGVS